MLGIHHLPVVVALLAAQQQQPDLQIRGTVVGAENGQPLSFTIVTLRPGDLRQFTDPSGAFSFANANPGKYILSVRQIGYMPRDTQVVLREGSATVIHIALRRLAIELPPVTVMAPRCTNPGPPDSGNAALVAVFNQLQENARRYELLADSFPYEYELELSAREVSQRGDTSDPVLRHLQFSSKQEQDHQYKVGRVVEPAWGAWGNPDSFVVIHSAELQDLGNPTFVANHCFSLAGRDTIGGETMVRINFEPAVRIGSADMAGAAYLDTTTYELRYTETSLTKPERSPLFNVQSMVFRTRFHNIAPSVPLQDSLIVVTTYRYGPRFLVIDVQRTVNVRFRRHPPSQTPPPPAPPPPP